MRVDGVSGIESTTCLKPNLITTTNYHGPRPPNHPLASFCCCCCCWLARWGRVGWGRSLRGLRPWPPGPRGGGGG
ncbi:hypothetical protein RSAG8_00753, partial [Rhizoctonia solani AG-8 WAC10335]